MRAEVSWKVVNEWLYYIIPEMVLNVRSGWSCCCGDSLSIRSVVDNYVTLPGGNDGREQPRTEIGTVGSTMSEAKSQSSKSWAKKS